MKKTGILIFFTLCVLSAFSQVKYMDIQKEYLGSYQDLKRNIAFSDISGSAYLEPNLYFGSIYFADGDSLNYFMRFNAYQGEMEFLQDNVIKILTNPQIINYVSLNNRIYRFKNYLTRENELKKSYLIELAYGKSIFYKKIHIIFEAKAPPKHGYDTEKPDRFTRKMDEYYISNKGPIKFIQPSKSNFIEFFSDQESKIKAFIKSERLHLSKEEDMIRLVEYYNSL